MQDCVAGLVGGAGLVSVGDGADGVSVFVETTAGGEDESVGDGVGEAYDVVVGSSGAGVLTGVVGLFCFVGWTVGCSFGWTVGWTFGIQRIQPSKGLCSMQSSRSSMWMQSSKGYFGWSLLKTVANVVWSSAIIRIGSTNPRIIPKDRIFKVIWYK